MKKKIAAIISVLSLLLLIILISALCIHQYRKPVYGDDVNIGDIKDNETVLAVSNLNWAWGYQNYGLAINKNGQAKEFDFSDIYFKDGFTEEELLGKLDKILEDDSIPFVEDEISLSAGILYKIINIENYKLRRTFSLRSSPVNDGGTYIFYSVYGSGNDRKLVKMRKYLYFDIWFKCNDGEINGFCKELGDYADKFLGGVPEGVR